MDSRSAFKHIYSNLRDIIRMDYKKLKEVVSVDPEDYVIYSDV